MTSVSLDRVAASDLLRTIEWTKRSISETVSPPVDFNRLSAPRNAWKEDSTSETVYCSRNFTYDLTKKGPTRNCDAISLSEAFVVFNSLNFHNCVKNRVNMTMIYCADSPDSSIFRRITEDDR